VRVAPSTVEAPFAGDTISTDGGVESSTTSTCQFRTKALVSSVDFVL
jgi:hypothetical protein